MDVAVFMAFHKESFEPPPHDYIIPIHVGSGNFHDKSIYSDAHGDNISNKNHIYSELTALYWIWKNYNLSKYVGLCHYRRFFDIDLESLQDLTLANPETIIVPSSVRFRTTLKQQYIINHDEESWDVMMTVLKKKYPDYIQSAKVIFENNNALFAYNMFIASRNFLNNYCEWLFSILFESERHINIHDRNAYQTRYAGFLSERLLTLYLHHNDLTCQEIRIHSDYVENHELLLSLKNSINNLFYKLKTRR